MENSFIKISTDEQNRKHLITTNTVTIPSHHICIVPLKTINQTVNKKFPSKALLEIEANPFLTIEKPELILIPTYKN